MSISPCPPHDPPYYLAGPKLLRPPELMVKRSVWLVPPKQEPLRPLAGFEVQTKDLVVLIKLQSGLRRSEWGWRRARTSSMETRPFSPLCLKLFLRLQLRSLDLESFDNQWNKGLTLCPFQVSAPLAKTDQIVLIGGGNNTTHVRLISFVLLIDYIATFLYPYKGKVQKKKNWKKN